MCAAARERTVCACGEGYGLSQRNISEAGPAELVDWLTEGLILPVIATIGILGQFTVAGAAFLLVDGKYLRMG